MNVGMNALPIGQGMTGIGAYAESLLQAAARCPAIERLLYLRTPAGPSIQGGNDRFHALTIDEPNRMWEQLQLPGELSFWKIDCYHSPLFTCPIVDEVANVITVHDAIPFVRPDLCSKQFLDFFHASIGPGTRAARAIITTSEHARSELSRYLDFDPERIEVLYQAVSGELSPDRKNSEGLEKLKLPEKYVLFLGMLEKRKGVETLVKAFGQAAGEIPDTFLVLAGRPDFPADP